MAKPLPLLNLLKVDVISCKCGMDHLNCPVMKIPKPTEWFTHLFICPVNNNNKIRIKFAHD